MYTFENFFDRVKYEFRRSKNKKFSYLINRLKWNYFPRLGIKIMGNLNDFKIISTFYDSFEKLDNNLDKPAWVHISI